MVESSVSDVRRPVWLERIGYPGLLVALVAQIVVDGIVAEGVVAAGVGRRLLPLLYLVVLVAALLVSTRSRRMVRLGLFLFLAPAVAIAAQVASPELPRVWHLTLFAVAASYILVAVSVLRDVLRQGEVTADKVMGALAAYLLFGLAWAFVYAVVWSFDPGALQLPASDLTEGSVSNSHPFVYFSFVTLTTLGYGDVAPISSTARMLALGEAVFGQLYIAVVLARLVGLELQSHRPSD